ncbi:MAG: hypothetical protein PHV85_01070 [Desulfovibrionaceae bacterium]|nr:hypothetical protein [Desulfovibrionaceae bacterium]MDD4951115.1 hypothetical protein [Desulfovibrionaceae bacterium]
MKRASLVLLAALAAQFFCPAQAFAEQVNIYQGRYQLMQVEYDSYETKGKVTKAVKTEALLKVDTEQGNTWILVDDLKDGKIVRRWDLITN